MFHLTRYNSRQLQQLQNQTPFTYSESFSFDEVMAIAKRNGITVRYCMPGSWGYEQYGCFTCVAYRKKQNPDYKPQKTKEKLDMAKTL